MAGRRASSRRPVMNPAASGTQIASTARIMSGHGTGAFFDRMASASQSGTASLSQSETASRPPCTLLTRSLFTPEPAPIRERCRCPPGPGLTEVVLGAVALVTAVPARLGARHPAAPILRAGAG